ncbi:tail fiber domain-containing protein [Hymenobacter sp. DH14]|uniref:Tail fiber domain-containing protein n=1 Tax=Hymenobacter cyanobacteriorum TaxID=2926463 RepID=A0A9X1VEQ1_9BACT|nr:tail fiber domain-containing protein [Hymenobacter cyanobacteriorum]MCI1187243.1 tail fiber domain-containing protein [Hymenobacter cyanobacteriorum]
MKTKHVYATPRLARGLGGLGTCLLLAAGPAHAQGDNLGNHSATQNLSLNDFELRLRSASDGNHGLGYYGSARPWNGFGLDGPVLFGYSGGILGTTQLGTRTTVLYWNNAGRVGIGTTAPAYTLHVAGTANIDGVLSTSTRLGVGTNAPAYMLQVAGTANVDGVLSTSAKLGVGTSAPVLLQHLLSTDTPALRLEQSSAGSFPAQTWDIGANEANFFVRDVTAGSLLPFRIRPGAPTSSLDISAAGNVGLGIAAPQARLHVAGNVKIDAANTLELGAGVAGKGPNAGTIGYGNLTANALNIVGAGTSTTDRQVVVYSEGGMTIKGNLTLTGPVVSTSDARLKQDVRPLTGALPAVLALPAHRYRFRPGAGPTGEQVGLLAQEVEKVYPELVSTGPDGLKAVNYAQLTPVLIAALQEQQQQLDALRAELARTSAQLRQATAAPAAATVEQRLRALEQALSGRGGNPAPVAPAPRPAPGTRETPDGRPGR